MKYLEDYSVGTTTRYGSYQVKEQEIIDFAKDFDDQPFHTDPEEAKKSLYGGIIASGWHTCAIMMRMICDQRDKVSPQSTFIKSPGFDNLKWIKPVRPGDSLSLLSEIIEIEQLPHVADRGQIKTKNIVLNQNDDVVTEVEVITTVIRRPK